MIDYESIRNSLNTGDIILYSGHTLFSNVIKLATQCQWSHCGMVIKLAEYDFVAVWESTMLSGLNDIESHSLKRGVQLIPLSDRVNKYHGNIAVRHLTGVEFTTDDYVRLMQLRKELSRKHFDVNAIELLKATYDGAQGDNKEDLSALFCSELVAEAYQCLGLLDAKTPSNEFTPNDFSAKRTLPLLKGELGKEIILKVFSVPMSPRSHKPKRRIM